jgi:periplasmic protein TonB
MFDSTTFDTLESAPRSRRWTTAISFLLQAIAVSVLLLIPLLYTEALPALHYSDQLTVPPGPAQPRHVELVDTRTDRTSGTSEFRDGSLVAPLRVPNETKRIVDRAGDNLAPPNPDAVTGGTATGNQSSAMQNLLAFKHDGPPPRVELRREPLRISTLSEGALLHRVQPVYPPNARNTRTQGPVVLAALIDTDGRIINLRLVSGHPLLVNAAMEAVKQWRYRPYILNSQPIEVETQITVVFSLN